MRVFTKSQRESQFGRAFISMFTEARQSAAAFEQVRKTLVLESVAQAGAVSRESSKRIFSWYSNPENDASLLSVQTRLCACLVVLDPDWTSKTVLATPLAFSLRGWQSIQAALDFLKAEAKGEREAPLKNFLTKAGVVL